MCTSLVVHKTCCFALRFPKLCVPTCVHTHIQECGEAVGEQYEQMESCCKIIWFFQFSFQGWLFFFLNVLCSGNIWFLSVFIRLGKSVTQFWYVITSTSNSSTSNVDCKLVLISTAVSVMSLSPSIPSEGFPTEAESWSGCVLPPVDVCLDQPLHSTRQLLPSNIPNLCLFIKRIWYLEAGGVAILQLWRFVLVWEKRGKKKPPKPGL